MIEQKIIDTFYEKIVPAAADNNPIFIDGWKFNVDFSTVILENQKSYLSKNVRGVTLFIKNQEEFNSLLVEYCLKMIQHLKSYSRLQEIDYVYFNGNLDDMVQASLLNVWFNATEEDFRNPDLFLKRRIDFLDNSFCKENFHNIFASGEIEKLNMNQVEAYIDVQNPSALETPFVFRSHIKNSSDSDDMYVLPNIAFGISENTCYVYAIQGKKKEKEKFTPYQKKVNRLLYRANENFVDDYDEESIKDVSFSQLFALTAFLKTMQEIGIEDIVVKNYYPLRYEAKEKALESKIAKFESKRPDYDSEEYQEWYQDMVCLKNSNDFLQYNINNKYLRIFRRLEYHLPFFHITSYPYELDNSMHMKLSKNIDTSFCSSSNVLNDVYESFTTVKAIDGKKMG